MLPPCPHPRHEQQLQPRGMGRGTNWSHNTFGNYFFSPSQEKPKQVFSKIFLCVCTTCKGGFTTRGVCVHMDFPQLGTHFEPGHAGMLQCPYTSICPTPQTSLPSKLQAPKRPIPHPGSASQGTCGVGEECSPIPTDTGDAGIPQEGPALQAVGQASSRDVPGSCCQLLNKYYRLHCGSEVSASQPDPHLVMSHQVVEDSLCQPRGPTAEPNTLGWPGLRDWDTTESPGHGLLWLCDSHQPTCNVAAKITQQVLPSTLQPQPAPHWHW